MWSVLSENLEPSIVRFHLANGGSPASYQDVLAGLQGDASLRDALIGALRDVPFSGYFWEVAPTSERHVALPFTFVLVETNALVAERADPRSFAEHFAAVADEVDVVAFPSLGRDATLIAPTPRGAIESYGHLASFVRGAPHRQCHSLFQEIGRLVFQALSPAPLWLSTSGLAVPWLHVRVDSKPKYYSHDPFRAPPRPQSR